MPKREALIVDARVMETFPSTTFKVKLKSGHEMFAYLAGKLRLKSIWIIAGDEVTVEISPYDLTKGRIIFRKTERHGGALKKEKRSQKRRGMGK